MRTRSTVAKACCVVFGGALGGSASTQLSNSCSLNNNNPPHLQTSTVSSSWSSTHVLGNASTAIRMASSKATPAKKRKTAAPAAKKAAPPQAHKTKSPKSLKKEMKVMSEVVEAPTPSVVTSSFGSLSSGDILEIEHIRRYFVDPLTDRGTMEHLVSSHSSTEASSPHEQLQAVVSALVVPLGYELGVPVSFSVLLEVLAEPLKVALEVLVATTTKSADTEAWTATLAASVSTQNGKDVLDIKKIAADLMVYFQQDTTLGSVGTLGDTTSHPLLLVTIPSSKLSPANHHPSTVTYALPASYEFFLRRVYPGIRDDASRSLSHIMRIAGWHGFGIDRIVQEPVSEQCVIEDDDEFGGEAAQIGGGMLLGENSYEAVKREYNYECSQQESTVYMAYLCHLRKVVASTNQSLKLLVSFDSADKASADDAKASSSVTPVAASGTSVGACITSSDRLSYDKVLSETNNAHDVFLQRQTTTDQRFASVNELIRLLGHNSRRATSKKQYMQFHRTAVKEEGAKRKEVDAIEAISHKELYQEVVMKEAIRIQSRGLPAAIRYLKLERGILATLDPYLQQYNNQGHKSDRVEGPGASAPSTDYSVLEKPAAEKHTTTPTPDVTFSSPRTLAMGPRPPPTSAELISCASRVSSPQFMHDIMAGCPSKRSEDGTPLPAWCFPFYAGYFLAGDDLQGIADKHVARAIKYVLMYDKAEDERETLRNACKDIKGDLERQYPYLTHLHGMILAATFRFFRSHEQLHRALKKSVDAADDDEVKKSRIKEIMMGNLRNSLTELEFVVDATMTHIETASHIPGRRTSVQDPEDVKKEKAERLFQYWYVDWLSRVATTKT